MIDYNTDDDNNGYIQITFGKWADWLLIRRGNNNFNLMDGRLAYEENLMAVDNVIYKRFVV